MKHAFYIFLCFSVNAYADSIFDKKLNLVCEAATFAVESDMAVPLQNGRLRAVSSFLSPFVASDSYSTRTVIECEADEGNDRKQCLGLNDHIFCKNPKDNFRFRSIRPDNSVLMIENRCNGGYKKYINISQPGDGENSLHFMEDRMYFKLKNQIHATGDNSSYMQPILTVTSINNQVFLTIEGFRTGHWQKGDTVQALKSLKADITLFETPNHEQYKLKTVCKKM